MAAPKILLLAMPSAQQKKQRTQGGASAKAKDESRPARGGYVWEIVVAHDPASGSGPADVDLTFGDAVDQDGTPTADAEDPGEV